MIPPYVEIDHEYHIIELQPYNMPSEVMDWLIENFGKPDGSRWTYRHPKIYFKNSKDHLMFTLRWS